MCYDGISNFKPLVGDRTINRLDGGYKTEIIWHNACVYYKGSTLGRNETQVEK